MSFIATIAIDCGGSGALSRRRACRRWRTSPRRRRGRASSERTGARRISWIARAAGNGACDSDGGGVPLWAGVASVPLSLRGVSLRYRTDAPLVLRDVDLDVRRGEHVGIIGATGSGKSSLLQAILQLYPLE